MIQHFYHLYCTGGWRQILTEHLGGLPADWQVSAGIIGDPVERYEARQMIRSMFPGASFTQAAGGHEQVTLHALHAWAKKAPPATPVLYAHSKGVTRPADPLATAWRRSMTRMLVGRWQECVQLLEHCDAVGCHWLTSPTHPTLGHRFFGGNFWWARAGYVAGLPACSDDSRWVAETWIGLNDPAVADLLPGWPSLDLFARAHQVSQQ